MNKLEKCDRNTILIYAAFHKDICENENVKYSLYDKLLDMINSKYCTITFRRASSGRFLTSDNPSVLSFDKDGVSLTLPINDHLLISIVYSPNENLENYNLKCFDIDQDKVNGFNKIIICGAGRYIFGENISEQEIDFIKESIKEHNGAEWKCLIKLKNIYIYKKRLLICISSLFFDVRTFCVLISIISIHTTVGGETQKGVIGLSNIEFQYTPP